MTWNPLLTSLLPLALIIAVSPLTVIPAVLTLSGLRPRATGLTFAVGWLAGLTGLTALFVSVSGLAGGLHRAPPTWASWLRIVVGVALIGYGIQHWVTRNRRTEMPRWLRSFTTMSPPRAGVIGAALTVARPEVLLMCAAAGLAIGSAGLDRTDATIAAGFFVAAAASTVVVPVLGYVGAGNRLDAALTRLKEWMEAQHATMLAVVLVLIGAMVLYNGIHAL